MEFEREVYQELKAWKSKEKRKPMLLMGARQIGKTTVLKAFASKEYDDWIYLNLEREVRTHSVFEGSKEPNSILDNLSLFHGKDILPGKTLIILDEIQECRDALIALKYFKEERPDIHIIGAGSLLGLTITNTRSFPVGQVEFIDMYPLSFAEYLLEADSNLHKAYYHFLEKENIESIPAPFFNPLQKLFKEYLLYGGMPEVASAYLENRNMQEAQEIQDRILKAYQMDFVKHADKNTSARIKQTWNIVPAQLGRENKKFVYGLIRKGARAKEFEIAIQWLSEAGLCYKVNKTNKIAKPLMAYQDFSAFKLYVFETGILIRLARLDPRIFILGDQLFTEFKGSLAENYVCTSLKKQQGHLPYYWTSNGKAEIDYIISYRDNIIPIEVKSGKSTKAKSLSLYKKLYQPKMRVRLSNLNLKKTDDLLNIPLFYADKIESLVAKSLKTE